MRINKLILLMVTSVSFNVSADVVEHYKTKTFRAETTTVLTPKLLKITAYLTGNKEQLSKVYIQMDGLVYDDGDHMDCSENSSSNCTRLMNVLDASSIQFTLSDPIGESAFNGAVYVNGVNLRHTMLREGWYKFDYKVGRSHYDILLQKEAECKRKGIWKHVTYSVTDERCQ
jgi:hypothetical protein